MNNTEQHAETRGIFSVILDKGEAAEIQGGWQSAQDALISNYPLYEALIIEIKAEQLNRAYGRVCGFLRFLASFMDYAEECKKRPVSSLFSSSGVKSAPEMAKAMACPSSTRLAALAQVPNEEFSSAAAMLCDFVECFAADGYRYSAKTEKGFESRVTPRREFRKYANPSLSCKPASAPKTKRN